MAIEGQMLAESELSFILRQVEDEVIRATVKFGPFNSSHEGYAVLKEEVDELWDDVKKNRIYESRKEAVQVAAMAVRYLLDVRDKK